MTQEVKGSSSLEQLRDELSKRLKLVKELCETDASNTKTRLPDSIWRAERAMDVLRMQASTFQRQMSEEVGDSSELHWAKSRNEAELKSFMKEMELENIMERGKAVEAFGRHFREVLPESALHKMARVDESPGELLIRLTEVMSHNEDLVGEIGALEKELVQLESSRERLLVAYSNADAGAQLSCFEVGALDSD